MAQEKHTTCDLHINRKTRNKHNLLLNGNIKQHLQHTHTHPCTLGIVVVVQIFFNNQNKQRGVAKQRLKYYKTGNTTTIPTTTHTHNNNTHTHAHAHGTLSWLTQQRHMEHCRDNQSDLAIDCGQVCTVGINMDTVNSHFRLGDLTRKTMQTRHHIRNFAYRLHQQRF